MYRFYQTTLLQLGHAIHHMLVCLCDCKVKAQKKWQTFIRLPLE